MNQTKNIIKLSAGLLLAIAATPSASAQGTRGGPPAGAGGGVAHLTAAYAQIVQFDADNNGLLDEGEKGKLLLAMASGEVKGPSRGGPPQGVNPSPEQIVTRIADMYATIAPYDANANRRIDPSEEAAIQSDIMKGKLRRPGARAN